MKKPRKIIDYEAYKKLPWYKKLFQKTIPHFQSVEEAYSRRPKVWMYTLILAVVVIALMLYFSLDLGTFDHFRVPNWAKFGKLLEGFAHPDWEYMFGYGGLFQWDDSVVYQCLETFAIAFLGTLISSILSIPFGFFASRKMIGKWAIISETLLILIRTFPEILFGYIVIQVTGFGALAGVVVLSIHSIGMIGKMYSEELDLINPAPLEALDAVGATKISRIHLGVVPQVAPNFLSVILYRFDLNVRTASLLGLVGAGGVGYPILIYSQGEKWSELAAVLYGIIVMVILIDLVSSWLRKKLL